MTDFFSYLPSFIPLLPMSSVFWINFGFARFFRRHQHHKRREMICYIGVSCSFLAVIFGIVLTIIQHLILFSILGILLAISICAILCHFYYYIVERPIPLDMVTYERPEIDTRFFTNLFKK